MFFTRRGGDIIRLSREKDPSDYSWKHGLERPRLEGGSEALEAVVIIAGERQSGAPGQESIRGVRENCKISWNT